MQTQSNNTTTESIAAASQSQLKELQQTALFIISQQQPDGAIPWYQGGKLDPWDHVEAAMALSVMGHIKEAEAAYLWLAEQQRSDGSWQAQYFAAENFTGDNSGLRETNFVAYVATGAWHHYRISGDKTFLQHLFPCVQRAIDYVLRYQTAEGDIAWAVDEQGRAQNDALLTACASILRSLECAIFCANVLNQKPDHWLQGARALKNTLLYKPFRFDRTWPSKQRFAMDWYYPVLAGIYSTREAQLKLHNRWPEFVEPGLGCRCVNDEPWVTMAETSELVIALVAAGQHQKAQQLFATLKQWRNASGAYPTGYVFRDHTLWPEETTSWTAAAVVLAADALFQISPAHDVFTRPTTINP